jgi:hypothetical protein
MDEAFVSFTHGYQAGDHLHSSVRDTLLNKVETVSFNLQLTDTTSRDLLKPNMD